MELPLFPLNTVLFPGMPLPLHIFEQRYRTMIGTCLESDAPEFGVVLLRAGGEVVEGAGPNGEDGPPPVPHDVGTIARIVEWRRESDGRYLLACLGTRRFRITRLTQHAPFLIGDVALIEDPPVDVPEQLGQQVRDALVGLLVSRAGAGVSGGGERGGLAAKVRGALPEQATTLSFLVPRVLTIASNDEQQRLLEASDAAARLRLELPFILREQAVAREMRQIARRAALN